jgi:hypothetical protein
MAIESVKKDNFLNVPVSTVASSLDPIDLPIFYHDYAFVHFLFWANYQRALP